jgi:DNA replication and repair protein RecF
MRRNLLDRIALYSDPNTQECRLAYSRALRHRQHLLDQSGHDAKALLAFESILAQQGLQYASAHSLAAARLCQHLPETFAALCSQSLSLEVHFSGIPTADPEVFRRELYERRTIDKHSRRASWGPHRDELSLSIDGKTARHHASQGQQRLLALALKLAELKCIQAVRQTHPVLLLDDVSSELDQSRTSSVFDWLRSTECQVFLTSPRNDLLDGLDVSQREQRHFTVDRGEIRHIP